MDDSSSAFGSAFLFQIVCLTIASVSAQGCGPNVPANPTTYAVHGKVTLDGQPVKRGFVRFDPTSPGKGVAAEGEIQADGSYEARAFVGQRGTTPGDYKVYVAAVARPQEGETNPQPLDLPAKYQSAGTTDITKSVTAGENSIDIELTSK